MYVYLYEHLRFALSSFILGIILFALYEVFFILKMFIFGFELSDFYISAKKLPLVQNYNKRLVERNIKKNKNIISSVIIFVFDLLYMLLVSILVLILNFYMNNGIPRFFSFLSLYSGYRMSNRILHKPIYYSIEFIIYISGYVLYILLYPINIIVLKIQKMIYKLYSLIYNKVKNKSKAANSKKRLGVLCKKLCEYNIEI